METQGRYEKQNTAMKTALIILGILLLLAIAGMTIFIVKEGRVSDKNISLENDKQILMDEYQRMKTERDNSRQQTAEVKADFEKLQSDFEQQISSRDAQISGLRARATEVVRLQKEIEEFKLMQTEYENLQNQHSALLLSKESLEAQFGLLTDRFETLQDSVDTSRGLHAYNINVLTKWDRWLWADRYNVSRARRVDQTNISMELAGTPFTLPGNRTVYMNMISPVGEVMYPSTETFEILNTGEQTHFTQMKEINFTGETIPLNFTVNHPEKLDAGIYLIRIYADGKLLRTKQIEFE